MSQKLSRQKQSSVQSASVRVPSLRSLPRPLPVVTEERWERILASRRKLRDRLAAAHGLTPLEDLENLE